jgi:hypothetical protein
MFMDILKKYKKAIFRSFNEVLIKIKTNSLFHKVFKFIGKKSEKKLKKPTII